MEVVVMVVRIRICSVEPETGEDSKGCSGQCVG